MEFEGVVVQALPQAKGVSARGEWVKQEVIFEQAGEFGRKVCVSFWGDRALDAAALKTGDRVKVAANVESREYNGRWYTEVRAWKMERAGGAPAGARGPEAADGGAWDGAGGAAVSPRTGSGSGTGEDPMPKEEFDDLPF